MVQPQALYRCRRSLLTLMGLKNVVVTLTGPAWWFNIVCVAVNEVEICLGMVIFGSLLTPSIEYGILSTRTNIAQPGPGFCIDNKVKDGLGIKLQRTDIVHEHSRYSRSLGRRSRFEVVYFLVVTRHSDTAIWRQEEEPVGWKDAHSN